MDIAYAFKFAFDDPQWVSKLAILIVITLLSILFTPLLIGLAGWAVLLGYQIALMGNVMAGVQHPLPRWDDLSEYFSTGTQALIGGLIYGLPLILIGCTLAGLAWFTGEDGGALIGLATCCLIPLLLVYALVMLPMYNLALGRFVEDPRLGVFLDFGGLLAALRARMDVVGRFILLALFAGLIFSFLNSIPCVGTVASMALTVPVNGMLAAQFYDEMRPGKVKAKPKPAMP